MSCASGPELWRPRPSTAVLADVARAWTTGSERETAQHSATVCSRVGGDCGVGESELALHYALIAIYLVVGSYSSSRLLRRCKPPARSNTFASNADTSVDRPQSVLKLKKPATSSWVALFFKYFFGKLIS